MAIKLFKEATELGSSLAHFNLGVIYLDTRETETFSFG
jgi:TPR repeat protein